MDERRKSGAEWKMIRRLPAWAGEWVVVAFTEIRKNIPLVFLTPVLVKGGIKPGL